MTDNSRNSGRRADGRFTKGNPGRPFGTRHKITRVVESIFDGEAEALTRKAVEKALEGDAMALRLCLERIVPPRKDRPVSFPMPKIENPSGAINLMSAMLEAVGSGEVTPCEASEISKLIEGYVKTLEMTEFAARLKALEERTGIGDRR